MAISDIAVNWEGGGVPTPKFSTSREGPGPLSNTKNVTWDHTSVPAKWHLIRSNNYSKVHECDRRHTYMHTYTQKDRPRYGNIAAESVLALPPKNI